MTEIRIHGRGGQGVVTAAELIAIAAFCEDKVSQAFPAFGVERTGAPIEAFARVSEKEIRTREQVNHPHILIIQDATLIGTATLMRGCDENTIAIVNTGKSTAEIKKSLPLKNVFTVDATKAALETIGKNIVNTTILGAFAKATGTVSLESLKSAINEKFKDKGRAIIEKNIKAIEKTFNASY